MTPKEKAKELVCKYVQHSKPMEYGINFSGDIDHAIECALICVDEMLGIYDIEGYDGDDREMAYLEEVKEEINKL
tara:strand:+ start:44 stop:268 length:225 start_codon:yes stop_codon:yes gene_type:complete